MRLCLGAWPDHRSRGNYLPLRRLCPRERFTSANWILLNQFVKIHFCTRDYITKTDFYHSECARAQWAARGDAATITERKWHNNSMTSLRFSLFMWFQLKAKQSTIETCLGDRFDGIAVGRVITLILSLNTFDTFAARQTNVLLAFCMNNKLMLLHKIAIYGLSVQYFFDSD